MAISETIFLSVSQSPLRYLVRSWSQTGSKLVGVSFEPVCEQLRTSFEPASVMEFGFNFVENQEILILCYC